MGNRQRLRQGGQVTYRPTAEEAEVGGAPQGAEWTAVVAKVHLDGTANLHVLESDGETRARFNVPPGSGPGTYSLGLPSVSGVGINVKIPAAPLVDTVAAATYTLQRNDDRKTILFSQACQVTLESGMPLGYRVDLVQDSASAVELQAGAGVVLKSPSSLELPLRTNQRGTSLLLVALDAGGTTALVRSLGAGGLGGAGGGGWIYISDVTVPGGTASAKVWQDAPSTTVLQEVTVSAANILLHVRASYPIVSVLENVTLLAQVPGFPHYEGTVAVTVAVSGDVSVDLTSPDAATTIRDTVLVTLDAPPQITDVHFSGPYPGAQTALKEDDSFLLQVVANKLFDQVEIVDFGAAKPVVHNVAPALSATVAMTAADRGNTLQALAARVRVRDAVTGAFSTLLDTNWAGGSTNGLHLVNLTNLGGSVAFAALNYPGAQGALKGVEAVTVNHTATAFDVIAYSDPTGHLNIANPAVYEPAKIATLTNPGATNETTPNFRVTLTRNQNGKVTVFSTQVLVQDVAPTISLSLPAARLRSGGNNGTAAQNYTLTLTSNQQLALAPTLTPDAGGFRGAFPAAFVGGPSVWTRQLRVDEAVPDEKGTFAFASLVATNRAGLVQNAINTGGTYVLGGFVPRTLSFAIFASTTSIGTAVIDFSKLTAGIFTQTTNSALKQNIGTAPPVVDGYTIDALSTNPTSLIWLDTTQVGANGTGLATITNVEETV